MKLLGVISLVSMLAVTPLYAKQSSEPVEITKVFEKLNLSAEQKQQMKLMREEMQRNVEKNKVAVAEAQAKLDSVLDGESSDETIRTAHAELVKQRNELESQQLEHMLKVRALLTPEQRKTFSSLRPRGKNGNESRGLAPNHK
ncbi:MAG: Spy/CpxP family protein refolding chaperone [Chitinophagaceae bacterium]|nr:Spy/CpxP family protein refolding chaperone [Oligoflexus sp.]